MKLSQILKNSCLLCKMGVITIMQHGEKSLAINVKVQGAGTLPIGASIASEHSEQSGTRHRQIPDVGFLPPSTAGHQSSSANTAKFCIWVECPQASSRQACPGARPHRGAAVLRAARRGPRNKLHKD